MKQIGENTIVLEDEDFCQGYGISDYELPINDHSLDMSFTNLFMPQVLTISDNDKTLLTISWKDGVIDAKLEEGAKMTDACRIFFDWLKDYVLQNYDVLPKKNKGE